jgi:hypothetical protein
MKQAEFQSCAGHSSDISEPERNKEGGWQVGIYILVVLVVVMLAAIVVTQEPDADSELPKAARSRRGAGYVLHGPKESLATTAGTSHK